MVEDALEAGAGVIFNTPWERALWGLHYFDIVTLVKLFTYPSEGNQILQDVRR